MDLKTAAEAGATIIQMFCIFRAERKGKADAGEKEFMDWLTYHKFEDVKSCILNTASLQIEIQEFLRRDIQEVGAKLDLIQRIVSTLASRIDGLAKVAAGTNDHRARLSDDALEILQKFAASQDLRLVVNLREAPPEFLLLPSAQSFHFESNRFVADDVGTLQSCGLLHLTHHDDDGSPVYSLTRAGADYAVVAELGRTNT